jgi:hypothetical protein
MIEGIHGSSTEYSVAEVNGTDILLRKDKEQPEDTDSENKDKSKGYELSLSDKGWDALERDASGKEKLSEEDQRKVDELEKIDRRVRTHEQAHLSAAGGYARGGANYDLVTGPDGKRYANGGHVDIDTSKESTPEATIRKAEIVRKAALAPADPSPSDRQIAADATEMARNAQTELAAERAKKGDSPALPSQS